MDAIALTAVVQSLKSDILKVRQELSATKQEITGIGLHGGARKKTGRTGGLECDHSNSQETDDLTLGSESKYESDGSSARNPVGKKAKVRGQSGLPPRGSSQHHHADGAEWTPGGESFNSSCQSGNHLHRYSYQRGHGQGAVSPQIQSMVFQNQSGDLQYQPQISSQGMPHHASHGTVSHSFQSVPHHAPQGNVAHSFQSVPHTSQGNVAHSYQSVPQASQGTVAHSSQGVPQASQGNVAHSFQSMPQASQCTVLHGGARKKQDGLAA